MSNWLSAREAVKRVEDLDDPNRPRFARQRAAVAALRQAAAAGGVRTRADVATKYQGVDQLLGMGGFQVDQQSEWLIDAHLWINTSSYPQPDDIASFLAGAQRFNISNKERTSWLVAGLQFERKGIDLLAPIAEAAATGLEQLPPETWWTLHQAVAWITTADPDLVDGVSGWVADLDQTSGSPRLMAWAKLANTVSERTDTTPPEGIFKPLEAAKDLLCKACEKGAVRATGIPNAGGERRVVPSTEFIGAKFWHADAFSLHRVIGESVEKDARWLELEFSAVQVQSLTTPSIDKPKRGRPPESGSYASSDANLVDKMRIFIKANPGTSATRAARQVVQEAAGSGIEESKISRLVGAYKKAERKGLK